MRVVDHVLFATIDMLSTSPSQTDRGGFHLTSFSTMEFLSQLKIIHAHHEAGFEKKEREGWMLESHIKCKRSIRSVENIKVKMVFTTFKITGSKIMATCDAEVTDDQGGLFEAQLKSMLL